MILTKFLTNNSKQLIRASRLTSNQASKVLNLNQINYRSFTSTPAKKAIASTAVLSSANWVLFGSTIALPYALASKSQSSNIKLIRSLSAILVAGSLLILSTSTETNPYTGKLRLMFKDVESEIKSANSSELSNLDFYKIIGDVDPALKGKVDGILTKLKQHSASDGFKSEELPNWHLIDSEDAYSFGLPNNSIFIYKGLLTEMVNSDQLAYFLAHTLSHQILRHETELFSVKSILNSLSIMGLFSISLLTPWGVLTQMGAGLALIMANKSALNAYSREKEREADSVAFFLTVRAGFNPKEFENYWSETDQVKSISSTEEPNFINNLANHELVRKLKDNINYYLFADKLSNSERANRVHEQIAYNQEFLDFARVNPSYKWESLLKCNYWTNRHQI
jgi:Zn-dependent protease with chaperone function